MFPKIARSSFSRKVTLSKHMKDIGQKHKDNLMILLTSNNV